MVKQSSRVLRFENDLKAFDLTPSLYRKETGNFDSPKNMLLITDRTLNSHMSNSVIKCFLLQCPWNSYNKCLFFPTYLDDKSLTS